MQNGIAIFCKIKGSVNNVFFIFHIHSSLSNAEDERDNMKEMNEKLNQQILDLADKFQKETQELQECKLKLQEADSLQQRLEQEILMRQEVFREAKSQETILLAQVSLIMCCN